MSNCGSVCRGRALPPPETGTVDCSSLEQSVPTMVTTDRATNPQTDDVTMNGNGSERRGGPKARPQSSQTQPPVTTDELEKSAQHILDIRAKYPGKSLAKLYNKEKMPDDLREAPRMNDDLVMSAYGFDLNMTESEVVARLMEMYERLSGRK